MNGTLGDSLVGPFSPAFSDDRSMSKRFDFSGSESRRPSHGVAPYSFYPHPLWGQPSPKHTLKKRENEPRKVCGGGDPANGCGFRFGFVPKLASPEKTSLGPLDLS